LLVIVGGIVTCEVAFWVFLLAGLAVRYLLCRPRLSRYLLFGSPAADAALLGLASTDLARGATATEAHALAAAYLSFTVVFGPTVVRWADARFAHRFAGGPPPSKVPPAERARHEWREFGKAVLAVAITSALIGLAVLAVRDAQRTQALLAFDAHLAVVLAFWFLVGPVWEIVSPKRR
jgi:hypothetical protein